MAMINHLSAPLICTHCGRTEMFWICFRYGDVRVHEYRVGDRIMWDRNNVGIPGKGKVVTLGAVTICPHCHEFADQLEDVINGLPDSGLCEIYIEEDVITNVLPNSGKFDFRSAPDGDHGYGYLVLSE